MRGILPANFEDDRLRFSSAVAFQISFELMKFVDLKAQHDALQPALAEAIARVVDQSDFIQGSEVEAFESSFADLCGIRHCVSCANGTDALYIAMKALGAGPGDEVITTAHSWISTSETVTQTGAKVVFCDTENAYFTIDPLHIAEKVGPRTVGVIAVHLFGQPAAMDQISDLCRRHGLWLIEDCAQAHLSRFYGRTVGTFGDAATFSFYPGKNLGAIGDAGCIITNRDDLARFGRLFAQHGGKNVHAIEGICSRMDTIQAAVLNIKLPLLAEWNERRRIAASRYHALLCEIRGVVLPSPRPGAEHTWHLYVVRVRNRDGMRDYLSARGVPSAIHYPRPLPLYPAYADLNHLTEDFPVASRHAAEILSLPMHPFLTADEQVDVASAIADFQNGEV